MNRVRIAITVFMLILLTVVAMGWRWTSTHQQPPLRTGSQVVLAIAGLSGLFALATIWRGNGRRIRADRSRVVRPRRIGHAHDNR
jgi:hypothetical protein